MKTILAAVFACGIIACMAEPAPTKSDPSADPSVQASPASEDSSALESTGQDDLGASTNAQDCVFIQFCNAPGADGTICVVRNTTACQNQCQGSVGSAIIAECNADANFVCGGITSPARIHNCI